MNIVLCIGAQKAGTTWLYRALENRADVWLPPVKELHFFDEKITSDATWFDHLHGPRAPSARWRRQVASERARRRRVGTVDETERHKREWCSRYFFGQPDADWYRSLFPTDRPSLDITPEYAIVDDEAIDRAHAIVPRARIIYLLRNPIEREWSAAMMRSRANGPGPESVLQGRHLHARYCDNIDRWTSRFPELHVGWFDEIASQPEATLAGILRFIGGDPTRITLPAGRPNTGNVSTIPGHLATALARDLAPEIDALADRFGGPAQRWADTAEWLRRTEPTGVLEYPFSI